MAPLPHPLLETLELSLWYVSTCCLQDWDIQEVSDDHLLLAFSIPFLGFVEEEAPLF